MSVLRRALAPRCVHLRIIPRPANLSESREIFRVMQRFGELSMFKCLRYEYHNPADNIALAIYRSEGSARKALNASPIRFSLERVQDTNGHDDASPLSTEEDERDRAKAQFHSSSSDTASSSSASTTQGIDEILRPSRLLTRSRDADTAKLSTSPDASPSTNTNGPSASSNGSNGSTRIHGDTKPMPFDAGPAPKSSKKWFQISIDRSHVMHQDFIHRQPFWKQFDPMKSMAQLDLIKKVPHPGLSDVSKRPPNAHRTPPRVLNIMSEYVEQVMPTLKTIVEEKKG